MPVILRRLEQPERLSREASARLRKAMRVDKRLPRRSGIVRQSEEDRHAVEIPVPDVDRAALRSARLAYALGKSRWVRYVSTSDPVAMCPFGPQRGYTLSPSEIPLTHAVAYV